MNDKVFNISSNPHVRSKLTTSSVMLGVVVSLLPAALFGIFHFGLRAFLIIAASVITAVLTEFIFDLIAKRPNTVKDGSAVVTGLLLALSLSPSVPLYIPIIGSIFGILFVKCFFGGLGKNFMNPALAARCFLLISFGTAMTTFKVDGVSSATPLADLAAGSTVKLSQIYLGYSNSVIGGSAIALLIGGLLLWVMNGITWEIPTATLVVFSLFIALFGGQGFSVPFILTHICAGGILMGAFFMATDPATSPMTSSGQLVFGAIVGLLAGLFRLFGSSSDSVSYAIILSNLFVPFIDKICIPKPLGYYGGRRNAKNIRIPRQAVNLLVITAVAGFGLAGVYSITKDKIEEQKLQASAASYKEVLPEAENFSYNEDIKAAVDALDGQPYDTAAYGRTFINDVVVGEAADGSVVGYVFDVSSADGFDGTITLALGMQADGTLTGISFTELNETAGMGMRADEPEFKDQFAGKNADQLVLIKSGGASGDNEINSVSGASVTSTAVLNAVNTALAFYAENVQ